MGKKHCCLPPGKVDELFTRIEELEREVAQLKDVPQRLAAMEDAARAFAVVFAIPRLHDKTGDGD